MTMRTAVEDGGRIMVGDDPAYDYVRDWRQAQAWTAQEAFCCACKRPMKSEARGLSPLYGRVSEVFRCEGCGAHVAVSPVVQETSAAERKVEVRAEVPGKVTNNPKGG